VVKVEIPQIQVKFGGDLIDVTRANGSQFLQALGLTILPLYDCTITLLFYYSTWAEDIGFIIF
jgi:hypothetical protein